MNLKSVIALLAYSSSAYGFGVQKGTNVIQKVNSKGMIAGGSAVLSSLAVPCAAIATDAAEISDLPPPYVPVAVGFGLLIAVGVLTNSLGDVLADEASLGERSGARAKKEMERSRSSYFKK